jgi:hypothetical protein
MAEVIGMADSDSKAAVYVSWTTFRNSVEQLAQGVPNRIDRSVFPGLSGGVQNQLLSGLKFLGLTDEENKPTPTLHALAVPEEEERKKVLARLIRERYADLFNLDLMKATPAELTERMNLSFGVTGDTREKAVRFFLLALDYLGIRVNPLLTKRKPGNGGGSPKKRKKAKAAATPEPPPPPAPVPRTVGTARVFKLRTPGVELTISTSQDFLALVAADRKFIFHLTDQIEEYEQEGILSGQSQTNAGGEE